MNQVRDSLWAVPLALSLVGAVLGIALPWVDAVLGRVPLPYPLTPSSAARLVEVSAGAIASLAAVSFSMAMVTIQLAATQYTPRLLRSFMADRTTQLLVGLSIGTVVFLVVLVSPAGGREVLAISFAAALVLSVTAIALVPFLFHHVARSVETSTVVTNTARRTHATVARLQLRARDGEPPPDAPADVLVTSARAGYVQVLEEDDILEALPRGALARVEVAVGVFVLPGTPLVSVWAAGAPDVPRIHRAFAFSRERNHPQDLLFGIRQLVDIALRALSPSLNDPTTAIMAVNELGSVAAAIAGAGAPARPALRRRAERGRILWAPVLDLTSFLHHAFDDVAAAAGDHGRVVARVLEVLVHLAATCGRPELHGPLLAAGDRILEIASRNGPLPGAWPARLEELLGQLRRAAQGATVGEVPSPTIQ